VPSWKDTPVVLEKHTYPETSYFSVLLEKHTLRSCHPGKAHLLSWKGTPVVLERHTCCPGKAHLLSWKGTPVVLEKHTVGHARYEFPYSYSSLKF
jgi:hypothetical protein